MTQTGDTFKYYSQHKKIEEDLSFEVQLSKGYFGALFIVRLFLLTLVCMTNSAQEGVTNLFLGHWQQCRGPGLDYFYFSASSHRSLLRAPGYSCIINDIMPVTILPSNPACVFHTHQSMTTTFFHMASGAEKQLIILLTLIIVVRSSWAVAVAWFQAVVCSHYVAKPEVRKQSLSWCVLLIL